MTVVKCPSGWVVFWAECENYRSINQDRWFESPGYQQPAIQWPRIYYGGRKDYRAFDSGGRWLMSVHPHPTDGNGKHLLAFYHGGYGGRCPWNSALNCPSYSRGRILAPPSCRRPCLEIDRGRPQLG